MIRVLVVVSAEELRVGDALFALDDSNRIMKALPLIEVFNTGHERVQVTTEKGKGWFNTAELVAVWRTL